ncbi:plasmid pRiA4b ORF-3 family protein [Salinicoccus carnicancri]|uniref:plasmid pRiA4b ORF-3 family protein n=1 Tax=Salinicoccus carnicancri TaxID=558170 RepID=UPI000317FB75|nr:plasmid pRiA4b ORF-3 family protein [Salinicoccus carnicancri]
MDLRRFYHVVLKDDALADMSISYINDAYFMSKIAEKMNPDERRLIKKLIKVRPLSGFYEITIKPGECFHLIKNRIILKSGDSGFIHVEVVRRLSRLIDIHEAEKRYEEEQSSESAYNALKLRITLEDAHTPVWREVMVPRDFNFYELHLVIQKAMGWQGSHLSSFFSRGERIFVYEFEMEDGFRMEGGPEHLLASETGIDPLLTRAGTITYVYDYGDDWMHEVEVLGEMTLDHPEIPEVLHHKGPGPIEDSGGVDGFREVHDAIRDKSHPEHEEWLLWAKSQNYKERYPKKAINRTLGKIFGGKEPVTESNDPTVDM